MKVILYSGHQLLRQSRILWEGEINLQHSGAPYQQHFLPEWGSCPVNSLQQPKQALTLSWAQEQSGNPVLSWAGDIDLRYFVGISATKEHDDLQIGYLSLNGLSRSFGKSFQGKLEGFGSKGFGCWACSSPQLSLGGNGTSCDYWSVFWGLESPPKSQGISHQSYGIHYYNSRLLKSLYTLI